jgi:hypothetical protein
MSDWANYLLYNFSHILHYNLFPKLTISVSGSGFFLYRLSQELETEQLRNNVKDREIQQFKYELQLKQNALTPESGHRTATTPAAPAAVTAPSEAALMSTMSSTGPLDYVADGASVRSPLRNRWADEVRGLLCLGMGWCICSILTLILSLEIDSATSSTKAFI